MPTVLDQTKEVTKTDSAQSTPSYQVVALQDVETIHAPRIKLRGGPGTGKTEALLQRVAAFLEEGVAPQEICIIVNTPEAARSFIRRLREKTSQAADVRVATIRLLCLEMLSSDEAREHTGRIPRLLNDAEYKFFLEDLKTSGLKPGRLKKMLNYFYYQWSQLEPESEWLLPREEAGIRNMIDEQLRSREAMLVEELAPLCVEVLASLSGEETSTKNYTNYKAVLVDDYQNLSKASQTICSLLAGELFMITGNENQLVENQDPYPFEEGFTTFEETDDQTVCLQLATTLRCPPEVALLSNALSLQDAMVQEHAAVCSCKESTPAITRIKWQFPVDEFKGLAQYINKLMNQQEVEAQDIIIVTPNNVWSKACKRFLKEAGIAADVVLKGQPLTGDPRSWGTSGELVAYTKLNLLANPTDVVAWRSWCGYDNHLCNSGAWSRLVGWTKDRNLSILEGLEALTKEDQAFLESRVLAERYQEGQVFIAQHADVKGLALVKLLGKGAPVFSHLAGSLVDDEGAEHLYKRMSQQILNQRFGCDKDAVRVAPYEALQGLEARYVIISGLVDGFMPSRNCLDIALLEEERTTALNAQRKVFYSSVLKTCEALVLSTIQKVDLQTAEQLGLVARRVKMEHGRRLAMLSPSVFIDEAGDTIPGAVSGEQFLGLC